MQLKSAATAKAIALLTAGLFALTACTTASQNTGTTAPSGAPTFDPASVQRDDALAAQVPDALKSKGTLVIGSDTTYAPAESLGGADGQTPVGYEVDLAKAIGSTLGMKISFQTAPFASILPSLGSKYDLGISSFFITKERSKAVNFVSYFKGGTQWAVQKGNPKNFSLDDICGKSVGVQTGTFQESPDISDRNAKCKAAGKPAINVVSLQNQTDVTTRLVTGGVDAMAAGSIAVGYAVSQTDGKLQTLGDIYGASPEGIAVAKNDLPMANLVAKTVAKLISTGDYQKILDAWGNGGGAITTPQVNPTVNK